VRVSICLLALVMTLAACDGHLSKFNIKEPNAAASANPRGRTFEACGGQDVVGTVRAVASSLGMAEHAGAEGRYEWWIRDESLPNETFTIALAPGSAGLWTVQLMDWPGIGRSELSRRAEAEIRGRLASRCEARHP
jgi:hypothetical protein